MALTFYYLLWSLMGIIIVGVLGWITTEKAWVSIAMQSMAAGVILLMAGG